MGRGALYWPGWVFRSLPSQVKWKVLCLEKDLSFSVEKTIIERRNNEGNKDNGESGTPQNNKTL